MISLQVICLILLGSYQVEGRTFKTKDVVDYTKEDSMRLSLYQFMISDRQQKPSNDELEMGTNEIETNDARSKFSRLQMFKSLLSGNVGQLCYGICSGDVGFCNEGCSCQGGICTPSVKTEGFHYGTSKLISPSEESKIVNTRMKYFLKIIGLFFNPNGGCLSTCTSSDDCHGVCSDCVGFTCVF